MYGIRVTMQAGHLQIEDGIVRTLDLGLGSWHSAKCSLLPMGRMYILVRGMGPYHIRVFLNVAYFLLVFCVADLRPLVMGGFFKLIASLMLACLLAFVVVHSPNLSKLLAACLRALPITLFRLAIDRRWVGRSHWTTTVQNEPSLSPLFQRPPPIFSL